jgi:hypothetical protein
MGCQWSNQNNPDFMQMTIELDPVEEHMHIKAWKDPKTRQRVIMDAPTRDVAETNDANKPGLEKRIPSAILLGGLTSYSRDSQTNKGSFEENGATEPQSEEPADGKDTTGQGSTELSDDVKERMAKVEREQETARKRELLKVDPSFWKTLAEQGYFQKAEDTLQAACEAEKELVGSTLRLARFWPLPVMFIHLNCSRLSRVCKSIRVFLSCHGDLASRETSSHKYLCSSFIVRCFTSACDHVCMCF